MIWDVLVAGAGPAGAVAAWVLARQGRRVLLVDDVPSGKRKVGESLPGAARPLLRDLELLSLVEKGPHLPSYGNLSSWGSDELIATDFIRDPNGPGWHLDRSRFDADLRKAARDAGVVLQPERVRSTTAIDGGRRINLTAGETTAHWLIDATGRHATLARNLGVSRQRDDSLVALCAWATPADTDLDTRTLVESTPDGWWYTARLPDSTRVVVLHIDAEHAASILHTPGTWSSLLSRTKHVSDLLAGAVFTDGPHGTEACGARLDRFAGKDWLAAGDAAMSFDPLSSQGILNALYTGMKAGQALHAALNGDLDRVAAYTARLESVRQAYLRHHRSFYQVERRWLNRSFWVRRQSPPTLK